MRLMKFVCSFAWADLEVQDAEKQFVARKMDRLGLDDTERAAVKAWLESPPSPEEVDPADVPQEHRQAFLQTIESLILSDDRADEEEMESLKLFRQLTQG